MSVQKIIQESISENPLGLKEAIAEELRSRVAEALSAKMEEAVELDEISKNTLGRYVKAASTDAARKTSERDSVDRDYPNRSFQDRLGHKKELGKKLNQRRVGISKAVDRLAKEEVEQIDELDKKTLGSYVTKAALSSTLAGNTMGSSKDDKEKSTAAKTIGKRLSGIHQASKRLAKEDLDLEETTADAPAYHYYVTNNTPIRKELKMLHSKNKPFTTERDALDHIRKQGGRQDGIIHKIYNKTGKIVSNRGVASGQSGYVSDVGLGDPKHIKELP